MAAVLTGLDEAEAVLAMAECPEAQLLLGQSLAESAPRLPACCR